MYRDDVAALEARHAALESEVERSRRELDQTTRLLDEVRGERRLPVLANLRVASPCRASWADMPGDDTVRHCGECKKNVYNLSALTRDEAEALIFAHEGRLCVTYYQRSDGTVLFGDCWVGRQKGRRVKLAAATVAAGLAGAAMVHQIGTELAEVYDTEQLAGLQVLGGLHLPSEPTAFKPTFDEPPPSQAALDAAYERTVVEGFARITRPEVPRPQPRVPMSLAGEDER